MLDISKGECILVKSGEKNFIFGMPFDYEIIQFTITGVEMVIVRALEICDLNHIESIAIPAIASNFIPESIQSINQIIQLGIEDYFTRNPNSHLKEIYLVNYKRNVFALIEK